MNKTTAKLQISGRLPGEGSRQDMVNEMLRVNHAGEYGAVRIYEGQLAVLKHSSSAPIIKKMAEQELKHLDKFKDLVVSRRVRPTAMIPIWHLAGFALGATSALMGEKMAHACTVAVEEVIDDHYFNQIQKLKIEGGEEELCVTFEKFRQEELEHRETALEHGAEEAPHYRLASKAIKLGSKLAIWLSKRI